MPRRLLNRLPAVAAALVVAGALLGAPAAATPARHGHHGGMATLNTALRRYLLTRTGHVTVAVEDLDTGQRVLHRPGHRQRTASIVKVEILMALLSKEHAPLQSDVAAQARRMIENSDNDDAQALFKRIGDGPGLDAFSQRVGLTHTQAEMGIAGPGYAWGLTRTTPGDQLRLLNLIVHRNDILTVRDRHYVRHLMTHIESDQRWGVTAGTSPQSVVALKNGWLYLSSRDWQINSIGRVRAAQHEYLIGVMSTDNPSMAYGVDTVQEVSRIVWRHL
jgi:beta-lactamase class A